MQRESLDARSHFRIAGQTMPPSRWTMFFVAVELSTPQSPKVPQLVPDTGLESVRAVSMIRRLCSASRLQRVQVARAPQNARDDRFGARRDLSPQSAGSILNGGASASRGPAGPRVDDRVNGAQKVRAGTMTSSPGPSPSGYTAEMQSCGAGVNRHGERTF